MTRARELRTRLLRMLAEHDDMASGLHVVAFRVGADDYSRLYELQRAERADRGEPGPQVEVGRVMTIAGRVVERGASDVPALIVQQAPRASLTVPHHWDADTVLAARTRLGRSTPAPWSVGEENEGTADIWPIRAHLKKRRIDATGSANWRDDRAFIIEARNVDVPMLLAAANFALRAGRWLCAHAVHAKHCRGLDTPCTCELMLLQCEVWGKRLSTNATPEP